MANFMERTAVLVDGGFYRIRAQTLFGVKSPEERADELFSYCMRHLNKGKENESSLYRIFYYDCPPSTKVVYNPVTQRHVNLAKSDQYRWTTAFFNALVTKRKVALRRGEELASSGDYTLRAGVLKDLCAGRRSVESLTDRDTRLNITQKGVDMRIGLDIASLVERNLVTQIILISGDSDFVPAAKYARRRGMDFVLDPMWQTVSPSLNEHVDGIRSRVQRPPRNEQDPLYHREDIGEDASIIDPGS
ncbi:NYN domain-containing protein [Schaalia meyeri]|uniref:NYN domain-containing protein n=1 Tax=Schaalia meyeri TaxID=52773 RepID=UPI002044A6A2|nr:NYN domain-containing protein [Schaalia meyeri]